ncbi:cytochrome P450 [Streptomyces albireticuli]|uniref:cytochrome P450 n=1 Tax=Streptomyces albireticuli TaxID=1940 RepID=UPI001331C3B7|nr:cytochrome P450 [Streptomyces albireticuli]
MKEHSRAQTRQWRAGEAPGALPLLGHGLALRRTPLAFLSSLPARGDIVRIRLGPSTAYVLCAPELVHQILAAPEIFDKGGPIFDRARETMGNGIGTSLRHVHRRQRALMQPSFSSQRITGYSKVMHEEVQRVVTSWSDGCAIDAAEVFGELAARATIRTLLGAHLTEKEITALIPHLDRAFHLAYRRMTAPIAALTRLPTPSTRAFWESITAIRALAQVCINRHRQEGGSPDSLIAALVSTTTDERAFTDEELLDQIVTLFFAGTESTGAALTWTFYHLANNPGAEEALHREVDDVLGGKPASVSDLPMLGQVNRCLTESLRLTPPSWLLSRTVTSPAELGGVKLPAGTTVFFSPYILHHLPEVFPAPEDYEPDRWLPERASRRQKAALLPFGHGARRCIGDTFGMTEASLALATIATRWRLAPDSDAPPAQQAIALTLNLRTFPVIPARRKH